MIDVIGTQLFFSVILYTDIIYSHPTEILPCAAKTEAHASVSYVNGDGIILWCGVVNKANGVVGACKSTSGAEVMQYVRWLVDSGTASNVAILVRRNIEADALEAKVRELGFRYSKVSGIDLFSLAAMRDFLAYVSVVVGTASRTDWARLLRRFALGVHSHSAARYLARGMFAGGG